LLPPDQPYSQAVAFAREAFPRLAGQTRTVLVFAAEGGLTADHERFLQKLTQELFDDLAPQRGWKILSPFHDLYLRPRLLAADNRAALIAVVSDVNYLTLRSIHDVGYLTDHVRKNLPPGLTFETTGEGGMGRDIAKAAEEAFHRTTWVTLLALMGILALIYRAPLAVFVPLAAIGVSVFISIMALNHLTRLGWGVSAMEKTMVVVLLFGSGTDFALFWLAAYRRMLAGSSDRRAAAAQALLETGSAIVVSAATTTAGLVMLVTANLIPSSNAGRALAVSLIISLFAALTLVPTLAVLLGKALYWPRMPSESRHEADHEGWWQRIARLVTARPAAAALVALLVLSWPAWQGIRAKFTYDALGILPVGSSSARGRELAEKHFEAAQLFSWDCMVSASDLGTNGEELADFARAGAGVLSKVDGVTDVWSLAAPLGNPENNLIARLATQEPARRLAEELYVSKPKRTLRWEVLLRDPPFSYAAMTTTRAAVEQMKDWAATRLGRDAQVRATGLTPYILDIKAVADADQRRVMTLVVVVIFIIVAALVRNIPLALIMVAGTVVVYLVTLGVTEAWFTRIGHQVGIDWKVKLFTFVILVAVGQDYNIFLITRLLQERTVHDRREAVRRAIAGTGGVISSCGAIMAATLGSLAATGLPFFQELGVAFAVGVLLDTFVVRPVVVPAAYLLLVRDRGEESLVEPVGVS
jgi:RND superfamily putative drug exporter